MKRSADFEFLKYRYDYWKNIFLGLLITNLCGSIFWVLKDLLLSSGDSVLKSLLCRGTTAAIALISYVLLNNYKNFVKLATFGLWLSIFGVFTLYFVDPTLATSGNGWLIYFTSMFLFGLANRQLYIYVNFGTFFVALWIIYTIFPEKLTISFGEAFFSYFFQCLCFSVLAKITSKMFLKTWEYNRQLYAISYHDQLTGLYNRRILDKITNNDALLADSTIFIVDIDRFKKLNDENGHDVGDKCILKVAETLTASFRKAQDNIIRYGGDEFVVIYDGYIQNVDDIYSRLLENLNTNNKYNITLSIGIAKGKEGENFYKVLKKADVALYKVKESTKNNYQMFEELL